jgi:hypothetical protein
MMTTIPSTTALCAAILGLLGTALTINVIVNRVKTKVDDGHRVRDRDLEQDLRMRCAQPGHTPHLRDNFFVVVAQVQGSDLI